MSQLSRARGVVTVDTTVCGDLYRIAGRRFAQFIEDFSRPSISPESIGAERPDLDRREAWDRTPWDEPERK